MTGISMTERLWWLTQMDTLRQQSFLADLVQSERSYEVPPHVDAISTFGIRFG